MIIVYVIVALVILGAIIVGVRFIGQYNSSINQNSVQLINKQEAVKERIEEFGVSNRGASMEDAPIYVVPYSYLGING